MTLRALRMLVLLGSVLAVGAAGVARQPGGGRVGGGVLVAQLPVAGLEAKLAALSPDNPEGYFLLAEELAAEVHIRESRDLARTLYVLAYELDRAQPTGGALARSATLGLAALTPNDQEQRWLRAIGQLMALRTPHAGVKDQLGRLPEPVSDDTALNLVLALGLARAGEGRRAEQYLARQGVRDLLTMYEGVFSGPGGSGAAQRLDRWISEWPVCPTCHNRRIITKSGADPRLCTTCNGNPGPKLSDTELLIQIRGEALLLKGVYRSWSAQLVADGGEPLHDPDPGELAAHYGVDAGAVLWRNSQWTRR